MRETEAETQAEGEAGSMQGADVALDPRTPGSHPGPKAGAKPLSHPGVPFFIFLYWNMVDTQCYISCRCTLW